MDKAKAAITDFMGRSGHHDTTVHEAVAPAVTQEVVKPHVHEEINTAIDKEVHQDHYHRTIQPVQDREVLPERHEAKIGAVQHREFDHRDHEATKRNLVAEQAQFRDERRVEQTTHSQSVAPVVGGEHVHHHIHETIQPVVQKETIQPSVVHTTVPIHEVHHNKATHHATTALPAMTMEQFKAKGGSLTGREERYDEFEGVPKNIGGAGAAAAVAGLAHKDGHHTHEHARHGDFEGAGSHAGLAGAGAAGVGAAGLASHHRRGSSSSLSSSDGEGGRMKRREKKKRFGLGSGAAGAGLASGHKTHNPADRNNDGKVDAHDLTGSSRHQGVDGPIGSDATYGTTTTKKPSLMDKLNPKVDADGDGKAGFMK